ncbi:MAG: VOC family protein [Lachnospiraceae bacterium]|nr:VOC family protein [Lachnospiraceae bacterium]
MQINPYVSFNGNCAEAVALYEKAFKIKAKVIQYKDAPKEVSRLAPENFIYHAQLRINDDIIVLQDVLPQYATQIGNNVMITLYVDEYDTVTAREIFRVLKEDGEIEGKAEQCLWTKCIGRLTDRFGVSWNICKC